MKTKEELKKEVYKDLYRKEFVLQNFCIALFFEAAVIMIGGMFIYTSKCIRLSQVTMSHLCMIICISAAITFIILLLIGVCMPVNIEKHKKHLREKGREILKIKYHLEKEQSTMMRPAYKYLIESYDKKFIAVQQKRQMIE